MEGELKVLKEAGWTKELAIQVIKASKRAAKELNVLSKKKPVK